MRKILLLSALLVSLASQAPAADNYTATAGSGLTFAAKDNGSAVLFSRFIGCDNTTTTQCWAVDASGRLTVNLAAASTIAATQSGTWTVQPGNTANTTPWLVGGNISNAASGVATAATNAPTVSYLYGFNGTTWDQVQVDASKFVKVNCAAGCTGAADGAQAFSITSSTTSTALALVGTNSVQFNLTGTWAGTVVGQISNDNTNWVSVPLLNTTVAPPAYIAAATGATVNGNYMLVGTQGARYARISVTFTSGTVAGTMTAVSQGPSVTFGDYINYLQIISSTPAGANIIGKVGIDQTTPGTTNAVSTTNWPTTVDTNSGNKSASTPRFVLATDQPNLTTALNVALAANQSVNTAQVNGVTTLTGTGAVGTGAQRVAVGTDTATIAGSAPGTAGSASTNVLSVQGIASMTKLLVTPDSVALPANQSVNVAQFGGVSTSTGQVAVSTAPVTATNTALVTALRPDSPGIIALGQTTKSASVPVAVASDQLGAATAANSLPITTGPALLGSYCMGANTGTMAAGLASSAPIFSFRYGAANLAIIRKITTQADDITTAFVAGAGKFDLIAARSFTASDTGGTAGTLTGNNGKLRTSFATTGISDFRISSTATLTAGTRTLDTQPLNTVEFAVSTSIDAGLVAPNTDLFLAEFGQSPLVLAQNEGFVIQATVPGTGTWVASVRVCWDEVSSF